MVVDNDNNNDNDDNDEGNDASLMTSDEGNNRNRSNGKDACQTKHTNVPVIK